MSASVSAKLALQNAQYQQYHLQQQQNAAAASSQQQQQQQQPPQRMSTPGLRYPSNRKSIYDRHLSRSKGAELSRASFAYLFVEMIGYAQRRVTGIADLEKRLNAQGYPIGLRLLDLLLYRTASSSSSSSSSLSASGPRPTRILPLLQFITTTLWRHLFGRPADALERSAASAQEYMVTDNEPLVNSYVSVPREMSSLNCAAFVAGIIEGVCDGAGFATQEVTAHWAGGQAEGTGGGGEGGAAAENMWPGRTIFLIRFKEEVVEREDMLEKAGR